VDDARAAIKAAGFTPHSEDRKEECADGCKGCIGFRDLAKWPPGMTWRNNPAKYTKEELTDLAICFSTDAGGLANTVISQITQTCPQHMFQHLRFYAPFCRAD
jgi:hypothetical protein